jgi:hypothetical protein
MLREAIRVNAAEIALDQKNIVFDCISKFLDLESLAKFSICSKRLKEILYLHSDLVFVRSLARMKPEQDTPGFDDLTPWIHPGFDDFNFTAPKFEFFDISAALKVAGAVGRKRCEDYFLKLLYYYDDDDDGEYFDM